MLRLIPAQRPFPGQLVLPLSQKSILTVWRAEKTCAYLIKYAQAEGAP